MRRNGLQEALDADFVTYLHLCLGLGHGVIAGIQTYARVPPPLTTYLNPAFQSHRYLLLLMLDHDTLLRIPRLPNAQADLAARSLQHPCVGGAPQSRLRELPGWGWGFGLRLGRVMVLTYLYYLRGAAREYTRLCISYNSLSNAPFIRSTSLHPWQ